MLQATISGLFTATFFLFISHARPLDTLSAQRPHPNIFSPYVILSLLGQFAIHITFLISAVKGAQAFMPEECIEPESEFSPNLVNTVSYMSNMMIQVCNCETFVINQTSYKSKSHFVSVAVIISSERFSFCPLVGLTLEYCFYRWPLLQ
jgi:cation-transporting ATPase 13A1